MIKAGLEYSYIIIDQGYIFLKINWNKLNKLYFHLAESKKETKTYLKSFPHCIAVSQVLIFYLFIF